MLSITALYTILAGFTFGLASTVRGNGLLSGIVFAYDAIFVLLPQFLTFNITFTLLIDTFFTIVAGSLRATEYLYLRPDRVLERRLPPLLDSFQRAPLCPRGADALSTHIFGMGGVDVRDDDRAHETVGGPAARIGGSCAHDVHVQIITRIASGYPLLYVWMAVKMVGTKDRKGRNGRVAKIVRAAVRFFVVYAMGKDPEAAFDRTITSCTYASSRLTDEMHA
ncbi:hypothetical protein MRB53_037324 [Persea americana]|nr:hypothetical protein MRB53_037324 [Persea americana]